MSENTTLRRTTFWAGVALVCILGMVAIVLAGLLVGLVVHV